MLIQTLPVMAPLLWAPWFLPTSPMLLPLLRLVLARPDYTVFRASLAQGRALLALTLPSYLLAMFLAPLSLSSHPLAPGLRALALRMSLSSPLGLVAVAAVGKALGRAQHVVEALAGAGEHIR